MAKKFNINDIDFSEPKQIKAFKERIVHEAYTKASSDNPKDHKAAAALKNVVDILLELERDQNVTRENRMIEINRKLNDLEVVIDNLSAENADLKNRLAIYGRKVL